MSKTWVRDDMPIQRPENLNATEFLRKKVNALGLGSSELARQITANGYPIRQTSAWSIMSDPRRRITLDEAVGLCLVFGWSLDDIADDLKRKRRDELGEYAVLLPGQ